MLPPTGSSAFRDRHKCYYQLLQSLQPAATCLQDQLLTKSFAYPGHQGAVKCITAGGKFVVSGGADDQLHIYDVQVGCNVWLGTYVHIVLRHGTGLSK